jgi:hypothetical protein
MFAAADPSPCGRFQNFPQYVVLFEMRPCGQARGRLLMLV